MWLGISAFIEHVTLLPFVALVAKVSLGHTFDVIDIGHKIHLTDGVAREILAAHLLFDTQFAIAVSQCILNLPSTGHLCELVLSLLDPRCMSVMFTTWCVHALEAID